MMARRGVSRTVERLLRPQWGGRGPSRKKALLQIGAVHIEKFGYVRLGTNGGEGTKNFFDKKFKVVASL